MGQEGSDQLGVEVVQFESRRWLAQLMLGKVQQQAECGAIGADCLWAGSALLDQSDGEERLQGRGKAGHFGPSSRWAASDSSSGAAWRYQYVEEGLVWPM